MLTQLPSFELSILVPAFNEARTVAAVLIRILDTCPEGVVLIVTPSRVVSSERAAA